MKIDPIEFVKQMDKKIIGQNKAKKTLGIALRNRWRRSMLSEDDRSTVVPKNILMIGDTGVGKTALVKAMADAIDAPLLKVEATKYTQTGYVGNSIREIIPDLADLTERKLNKGRKKIIDTPLNAKDTGIFEFLNLFRFRSGLDNDAVVTTVPNRRKGNKVRAVVVRAIRKHFYRIAKSVGYQGVEKDVLRRDLGFYRTEDLDFLKKNESEDGKYKGLAKDIKFTAFNTRYPWLIQKGYVPREILSGLRGKNRENSELLISRELIEKTKKSKLITTLANYLETKEIKYIDEAIDSIPLTQVNEGDKKWIMDFKKELTDEGGFFNGAPYITNKNSRNNGSRLITQKDIIQTVHKKGIIFIDEIDKLIDKSNQKDNIGKLGVQRDLLALLDGTEVETPYGKINTENIMFITAGAFHLDGVNDLMPELLGRMPIRVKLEPMTLEVLRKILLNKDSSPITEHKKLLKVEDIELEVTEEAIEEIARTANKINLFYNNTGARTLHTVTNRVLESISFNSDIRGYNGVVKIDKDYVKREIKDLMKEYNQGLLSDMTKAMYT